MQPPAGVQGRVPVQREVVQAGREGAGHDQLLHLHAQQAEQEADQAQTGRDQCSGESLGLSLLKNSRKCSLVIFTSFLERIATFLHQRQGAQNNMETMHWKVWEKSAPCTNN